MVPRAASRSALPADIRTAWQRLGDPAALSIPVALIYLPFAFAGPLFIDTRRLGGGVTSWFLVGLAGWLALFVVLTGSRLLLASVRRGRTVATILAIVLSVVARSVTLALTAHALGLTSVPEFPYRLNAAIFTQSALLIASAIVVSSYVHHGRLAADLLARQHKLTELSLESGLRLAQLRGQIRDQVRRAVDPIIAQLDAVSQSSNASRDGLQADIQQIVDEELRPLSHRLADSAALPVTDMSPVNLSRASRPPLPDRISLGRLCRPLPSGLLAALLASSQAIRASNPWDGLLFILAVSGSLALSVAVMRRLLMRFFVPAWWGLALVTGATAVMFLFIIIVWERSPLSMPPDLQWAALYSGATIAVLLGLEYLVNERRAATESQLLASVEELQAHSSMLRQHEFIASRQLSYVVHGSVQSALNAAAMRLALTPCPDSELVTVIRADIEEAISRIDTSGSAYVMLVQTLADLVELWEGTAHVAWTMDHRTVRLLAESPPTAASVGEIVTECASNAIRHGRARQVKATIQAVGDEIRVSVVDDGAGLPAIIEPRLGTRMLDELCLSWERTSTESGTTVVAQLATERALLATS